MAASDVDALKQEILSTNQFLENMRSMPNFQCILDVQARALVARIVKMGGIPAEAAASVAEVWNQGPWSETHRTDFGQALSTAVATGGGRRKGQRREGQDVRSFERFLSEKDIEVLRSDVTLMAKLDVLASRCLSIHLVLPTESSYRVIIGAGQAVGSLAKGEQELHSVVVDFKKVLKRKTKDFDRKTPLINDFPLQPDGLPAGIRQAAYQDDPPHSGLVEAHAVQQANNSLILRGSDKRIRDQKMSQTGFSGQFMQQGFGGLGGNMQAMIPGTMLGMMQLCQNMMQRQLQGDQQLPGLQVFGQGRAASAASTQQQALVDAQPTTSPSRASAPASTPPASTPASTPASNSPMKCDKSQPFQVDLEEEILANAAAVSDALDEKKNKKKDGAKTSESFRTNNQKPKTEQNKAKSGKGTSGKGTAKTTAKSESKPGNKQKGKGKGKAKAKAKAKSKGKGKGMPVALVKCKLSMSKRLELRPNGCSRCRWKRGCTPSCLTKAGLC